MGVIAEAVRHMLAAGMSPDAVIDAVAAMEAAMPAEMAGSRNSDAVERKRAADRERMRFRRQECSPDDWLTLRADVFARDGYACVYCGSGDEPLHCDHVVPLSRGGRSVMENLTTACASCNISKGDRTPQEWAGPCQ
ncbi:HNH endonuclease [Xanthobacter autotrophicus]|uniref:HNH endonuclease n=1 Tax=Xanthobacter autotrophicus TaxID=280 RepID=UPI00372CA0DE